jgi:pyrimidine-specific ribonucleoside hydrolase
VQHARIVTSGSGDLAIAALFAMILDPRIVDADLDFANACYEKRNLLLVPRVLLYGDIPRWAGLVGDRKLQLHNLPPEAGDLQPLQHACCRNAPQQKIPLIDCTDLYHPHQDVGDNFDIVAAYALPEVDLRAVVLDVTEKYRQPPEGPRDAGFIPITQLNAIFNRPVPCGVNPYTAMRSPDDKMLDAPAFQQAGVELMLNTLRQAEQPVDIVSFGSARAVALAYNREPDLLRQRVRRIHLCAGASSPDFLEWNVVLDPHAFVRLLKSDLPIALYPCATQVGPFAYGPHNCFWQLNDLQFIRELDPRLRRYKAFAFGATHRVDFLRAIEEDPPEAAWPSICNRPHNVWETCVWMQVTDRRLVQHSDGSYRIIPATDVRADDKMLPNELRPCRVAVRDNGGFTFELTDAPTNFWIYDRGDPVANERALREALPALYRDFRPQ